MRPWIHFQETNYQDSHHSYPRLWLSPGIGRWLCWRFPGKITKGHTTVSKRVPRPKSPPPHQSPSKNIPIRQPGRSMRVPRQLREVKPALTFLAPEVPYKKPGCYSSFDDIIKLQPKTEHPTDATWWSTKISGKFDRATQELQVKFWGEGCAKRFGYPSKITRSEKHTGLDHKHRLPTGRAETGFKKEIWWPLPRRSAKSSRYRSCTKLRSMAHWLESWQSHNVLVLLLGSKKDPGWWQIKCFVAFHSPWKLDFDGPTTMERSEP